MVSVVLPFIVLPFMLQMLGRTIDIRNYGVFDYFYEPIEYNETYISQKDIKTFNASYYVLPDMADIYSKLHAPLDIVLGMKQFITPHPRYPHGFLDTSEFLNAKEFEGASILVVAEYITAERSFKENVEAHPKWKESIAETHTHYVDKLIFGGRQASLITVRNMENRDDQIIKRLLREALGTSGTIGKDTPDLWERTIQSIQNHPDLRQQMVQVGIRNAIHGASNVPTSIDHNGKTVFEIARDLQNYVDPVPELKDGPTRTLYTHLKPLSDIDERYISLEKNVKGERYMKKMDAIEKDVTRSYYYYLPFMRPDLKDENGKSGKKLLEKLRLLHEDIYKVLSANISLYTDIDLPAFQRVFDKYKIGLKGNYLSYNDKFRRMLEKGSDDTCTTEFHTPTTGFLNFGRKDGSFDFDNTELSVCKTIGSAMKQCRSIAYTEKGKKCWIHMRSTATTPIEMPEEGDMDDWKIYDKMCPMMP